MFTHLDAKNRPQMVDVGDKPASVRTAHAQAEVVLPPALAALLQDGEIATKKGPIFQTAILAGVMGAKTHERTDPPVPSPAPRRLQGRTSAGRPGGRDGGWWRSTAACGRKPRPASKWRR